MFHSVIKDLNEGIACRMVSIYQIFVVSLVVLTINDMIKQFCSTKITLLTTHYCFFLLNSIRGAYASHISINHPIRLKCSG